MLFEMLLNYWFPILLISLVSYLIGCINASIVVTRLFKVPCDIRNSGSGNAGFTNVLRTQGLKMAVFTFIIDFLKGMIAVGISELLFSLFSVGLYESPVLLLIRYLSCFMCVMGHIYPCFFGFKGGKGILTAWACMLLVDWRIFILLISVFLLVLCLFKIVSLSSVLAAVSYFIGTFLITYFTDYKLSGNAYCYIVPTIFSCLVSMVVIVKHKSNIERIISGKEKKIYIHR